MWQLLPIAAAIAVTTRQVSPNPGVGANAVTYGLLCTLLAETLAEVEDVDVTTDWEQAYASILEANMSAAGPEWRQQFIKAPGQKKEWDPAKTHSSVDKAWADNYEKWAETAVELSKTQDKAKKMAIAKFDTMDEPTRTRAKHKLEAILRKVAPIATKLAALKSTLATNSKKAAEEQLKLALYGQTDGQSDFEKAGKTTEGARIRGVCGTAATVNGGQAFADVLLCVCADDSNSAPTGTKKICTGNQADHLSKILPSKQRPTT
uniref:Variant surface glycoprotein 1125.5688 n=1 Tax=Trypanosoma brucei TaxID=5691 RepID=A0A1J0RD24_9TRYP|nr:variant surface glycoprotein 1125.5688 [Trypanosoma brucei]